MDAIPWPWIFGFITVCVIVSWGAAGLVLWAINRHNRRHRY